MIHRVVRKQANASDCFVCGINSRMGLHAEFFETDGAWLVCPFSASSHFQGYPGRLHGGIASSILDETLGRSIGIGSEGTIWGVTSELFTKFLKPIPLDTNLVAIARVTQRGGRVFRAEGGIVLPDGSLCVKASGRFAVFPLESIAGGVAAENFWDVHQRSTDPLEFSGDWKELFVD